MCRIIRIFAVISVATTLAVGAASNAMAGEFNTNKNGSLVNVPPTQGPAVRAHGSGQPVNVPPTMGPAVMAHGFGQQPVNAPVSTPTVVHITTANGGFNWGDAAIGAAAGLAISLLVVGGGLSISQRRGGENVRHA